VKYPTVLEIKTISKIFIEKTIMKLTEIATGKKIKEKPFKIIITQSQMKVLGESVIEEMENKTLPKTYLLKKEIINEKK
jgi:hypothetical protein